MYSTDARWRPGTSADPRTYVAAPVNDQTRVFEVAQNEVPRSRGFWRGRRRADFGLSIWLAIGAYVLFQHLPVASLLARPIQYLGTWAHELGHCIASEILAVNCTRIEILPSGGGAAYRALAGNDFASAVISGAGLLGPSIIGAMVLVMSRRFGLSRAALMAISFAFIWTAREWGQDIFTDAVAWSLGGFFFVMALLSGQLLRAIVAQFFAVVFAVQAVEGWGYAMIDGFSRDGRHMVSDTGKIAQLLGGTHELWGTVIMGLAVAILAAAFVFSGRSRVL